MSAVESSEYTSSDSLGDSETFIGDSGDKADGKLTGGKANVFVLDAHLDPWWSL